MIGSKVVHIMANPSSIPSSLEPYLARILEMLSLLAKASHSEVPRFKGMLESFARLTVGHAENTIAILGERGTGKTTLLLYVCSRLLHDGTDIVFPVIIPERFAS